MHTHRCLSKKKNMRSAFAVALAAAFMAVVAAQSPSNKFWHNMNTGVSQDTRPECLPWKDAKTGRGYWIVNGAAVWEPPVQFAWRAVNTTEKPPRHFYENTKSNTTQWTRPTEMAWVYLDRDQPYYFNVITNETTRIVPPEVGFKDEERNATYYLVNGEATWEPPVEARWHKSHDAKRARDYYFNEVTKETVWTLPAASGLSWQKWYAPANDPHHVDL
jgi:hypothetical protein